MKIFASLAEFTAAVGTELGSSEWHEIDQARVDLFAEATGDHQWIHVDPERAKDGPFGTTIAYGYLTLSLIPVLAKECYGVEGVRMAVNYGSDKVRFPAPVPVGSSVRATAELVSVDASPRPSPASTPDAPSDTASPAETRRAEARGRGYAAGDLWIRVRGGSVPGSRPRYSGTADPLTPVRRRTGPRPAAFGAEPGGERLDRILRSPQFVDGAFRNPVPTRRLAPGGFTGALRAAVAKVRTNRSRPVAEIPVHRLSAEELAVAPASGLRLTWLGHATVLAEIGNVKVLFDPVWGERCSPFPGFGPRRLHPTPLALPALGPVDIVVVSHDHYDHLDMDAIRVLAGSGPDFAVPLGVGAHLEHWGVPADRIVELDWHESARVAGLTLTATPARHYCSRGPRTGTHQLWASWVVAGADHRIFHSGDTGYFPGFAGIGARYGPFDATMMQVGAYSDFWPEVHMTPEEGVRAHGDLGGDAILLPIHWATFDLAPHPWEEPVERTLAAARTAGFAVATPIPGRPFEPAALPEFDPWWRAIAAPAGTATETPKQAEGVPV
jgi:L-ascorbate metabolism protein UlaG (beta-lactamase superfamily)/acyl dehydratase